MNPLEPVDDVIVISNAEASQDNLSSALKRAFDRASELATRHNLVSPLRLTLSDAAGRCLLTMTMTCVGSRWTGRTEPGDLDVRDGIAFPWLLAVEDESGRELRIRLQLDPRSRPM
jgi:hypothetical protein